MGWARALCLLGCLALAAAQCDYANECCAPGTPQVDDKNKPGFPFLESGSFCTEKPFEPAYGIVRHTMVPMVLNFVDYCTDEVLYQARFPVEVDKFAVLNVPCTYLPASCSSLPADAQQDCLKNQAVWTNPEGSYRCNLTDGFYHKFIAPRICNSVNYGRFTTSANTTTYIWSAGKTAIPGGVEPATKDYCSCNRTTLAIKQNKQGPTNLTGVPDKFIKGGMSTFYTQIVIGGRKTSDDEDNCKCTSMDDTSPACMCMLGSKKVPYIYNNSYLPYLTALVSIQNGGLLYKNSWVKWNFDSNGVGCVGCSEDNCWGVPQEKLTAWNYMGRDLVLAKNGQKMCAISGKPDPNDATAPYCMYPTSDKGINPCDLKVYIAWVGTDAYAHACTTVNMMFSRFTQMGVSSMAWQFWKGASNLATDVSRKVVSGSNQRRFHEIFNAGPQYLKESFRRWFGFSGESRDDRM